MSKKLIIVGNYQAGNLGDEAIFYGLIEAIKDLNLEVDLFATANPKLLAAAPLPFQTLNYAPSGLRSLFRKKDTWPHADAALFGGGGLFVDQESLKAPFIWWRQSQNLKSLNIPYSIVGQSFGPLKTKWGSFWLDQSTKNAKELLLRDEESKKFLSAATLKRTKLSYDFALNFIEKELEKPMHEVKNRLLFVPRLWGSQIKEEELDLELNKAQKHAQKRGLELSLMSMEREACPEHEWIKKQSFKALFPETPQEALKEIRTSEAVISMRLHASIFAWASARPLSAIAYSKKVEAFFKRVGAAEHCKALEPQKSRPKNLKAMVQENTKQLGELCSNLGLDARS